MMQTKSHSTFSPVSADCVTSAADQELSAIELFIDLPNIQRGAMDSAGCLIDYGNLVHVLMRIYGQRLDMPGISCLASQIDDELMCSVRTPIAVCRDVWCVTSVPVNFHPEDSEWVRKH